MVLRRMTPFRALLIVALAATCTPAAVQLAGPPGNAPVMSVTVSPLASTIPLGASQQLTATLRDSAGAALTGRAVAWSSSNEGVAQVNGVGRVDAVSPGGPVTITATSEGKSGAASVTVPAPAPTLVRVILTPDTAIVPAGATRQFTAQGRMSDSTTVPVTAAFTATGGAISIGGLYTAGLTPGTFRAIATAQSKADTSVVTVTALPPTLVRVILTPDTAIVTAGGSRQFTAQARMSDSTTVPVVAVFTATGGAISVGGLYTAGLTPGTFRVIATAQAKADTSVVTVTALPPTLVRVILTPDTAIVPAGGTRQFTAQGRMSDSTTIAVAAVFTATGGAISIGGLYTAGVTPGTFRVIATALAKADTSAVTIVSSNIYTTNFDVDENPLSEGGKWLHLDPTLTVCKVVGGRAFGTQVAGSPNGPYDDSNVYLTGFGDNYEVEGTVWLNPGLTGSENREVEILLRWTDDGPLRSTPFGPTHANGYEITVQHAGQYMSLGRFKGAELVHLDAFGAIPKTGDRFRARIEGQRIRVWWNDVLKMDFTDTDASLQVTTGNPGIGFFTRASNTDWGYEAVTVRRL